MNKRSREFLRDVIITWMGVLFVCVGFAAFGAVTLLLDYDRARGQVVLTADSPMRDLAYEAETRTGLGIIALPTPTPNLSPAEFETDPYPPDIAATLDGILAEGQRRGNRPDVFSKVGDSITVSEHFLKPVGDGLYNLGEYAYLEPAIYYFSRQPARDGRGNSFYNQTEAAGVGWSARSLLDPRNANSAVCQPGETPLACEYRLTRPGFALIMIGTNDVTYLDEATYRRDLLRVVDATIEAGVVPVLSTIPPLPQEGDKVDTFNAVITDIAAERSLPMMDTHAAMRDLPNQGLSSDDIHPSVPPGGYFQAVDLENEGEYGYVARNRVTLEALYRLWAHVAASE
jgi:hypothetical protein